MNVQSGDEESSVCGEVVTVVGAVYGSILNLRSGVVNFGKTILSTVDNLCFVILEEAGK